MKIIFDSEEQKDKFTKILMRGGCPSDVGLKGDDDCCDSGECAKCWKKSNIKMEVKKVVNDNESTLTEASIDEIDQAIGEVNWTSKYEITERSSEIIIAALKYIRDLKEMEFGGKER